MKEMRINMKQIGILALQGAFAEHKDVIERLGEAAFEIRQKSDLTGKRMDGLIIPGGESTVMGKLLKELDMFDTLKDMIKGGLPVFGTCAGMILLAKDISNDENHYLDAMDISVKRNAYGRQLGSFRSSNYFEGIGNIEMTFIRAPFIEEVNKDKGVEILARVNGNIVAARQRKVLVTSFHPELTQDLRVHQYFLEKIAG